ncbi:MerR family transcriptional regulator, partial [Flavonifractor plautii]|uniref:MerR family transcriptional regulator n=1 Tax=Flavonifractor plautii TaxID=292800 RepID=UPI00210C3744
MTIGELEAALDMPRANIRFYVQEGFNHPRRGANNYRDYTEVDADTLRKVKLLRQLGLSLEEIRQAQRGERPLSALLGEQEAALARRRAELDWAGQVCRA